MLSCYSNKTLGSQNTSVAGIVECLNFKVKLSYHDDQISMMARSDDDDE